MEVSFDRTPARSRPPVLSGTVGSRSTATPVNCGIRSTGLNTSASLKEYRIGQQVKVKKAPGQPGPLYNDGVISNKNMDGSYDVKYSTNRSELSIQAARIQLSDGGTSVEGSENESNADVKDKLKLVDSIESSNDGNLIQKHLGASTDELDGSNSDNPYLNIGGRVQVKKNEGNWYSATITNKRPLDHYDVIYDADNSKELRVPRSNIRSFTSSDLDSEVASQSPAKKTVIVEGSKVEANYRGKGKYYPGRVKRDRMDGTFDIDYDDSEQETRVLQEWVRVVSIESRESVQQARHTATREVDAQSVENMIVSVQESTLQMTEQISQLSIELLHMKSREADLMALIRAQGDMIATLMKK